jgi:hypothetical protein
MKKLDITRKMLAANIGGKISGAGDNWEVEVDDEQTMKKFVKKVTPCGGFRTGYGSWILSPNYTPKGDFNSVASAWHY